MKFLSGAAAMLLAAVTLEASVVDVSSLQTVRVRGGDTLSFELFTRSYRVAAEQYGSSADPPALRFALVTSTQRAGEFTATLRSSDASISLRLTDTLDFAPGYFSSADFQGSVSTLQGQFQFDSQLSQSLFRTGSAWLDLTNMGGDVTLGLSPLLLSHDLYVSLSGATLSVGAINGQVLLNHPESRFSANLSALNIEPQGVTVLPEPGSSWLFVGGAALLIGLSGAITRVSRVRKCAKWRQISTVCNRRIHSDTI